MSKENNKKAPNVRFPGFDGDWEERKFGDLGQQAGILGNLITEMKASKIIKDVACNFLNLHIFM